MIIKSYVSTIEMPKILLLPLFMIIFLLYYDADFCITVRIINIKKCIYLRLDQNFWRAHSCLYKVFLIEWYAYLYNSTDETQCINLKQFGSISQWITVTFDSKFDDLQFISSSPSSQSGDPSHR